MDAERPLDREPLRRVLVVDDEDGVRGVLRRWLGRRGWEVIEAADGDAARAVLGSESKASPAPAFDLVICDLRMPRFGGRELHDWMSTHCPALVPRLIFASGDAREASTAAFLQRTGCPVLEKPFELRRLDATIALVLAEAGAPAPPTLPSPGADSSAYR